MKSRRQFYRKYVYKKFRRARLIQDALILVMSGIVLYDSFTHRLPLHYILFTFAGILAGRFYKHTTRVRFDEEDEMIREEAGVAAIVATVIVLSVRYIAGAWILEEFHVIRFSDALYLFFIGLHYSRIKSTTRQIDDYVYRSVTKKKREP